MKYLIIFALWLGLLGPFQDSEKLVKTKIDEGISFGLPESMHAMTDVEIASKYVSYRNALGFYTDRDRLADFIINHSVTPWSPEDMEMLQEVYKSNIYNLYTRVEMINEGLKDINGRKFVYFEFISTVSGDENSIVRQGDIVGYNYVTYAIRENKVFVFTFSCPLNVRSKWEETAHDIMESIKIK
jgi:hypothetical protein